MMWEILKQDLDSVSCLACLFSRALPSAVRPIAFNALKVNLDVLYLSFKVINHYYFMILLVRKTCIFY